VTATALFEPPFSQNPSLTRQVLRLTDEAMKKKIDEFIDMVLEEPKPVLYLQKYEHLKFHPGVRYKLKKSFGRLRPMLLKDAEYKERFNALGLRISNGIKSTMLPRETDLDPVLALGQEMAAYKSDCLAKDQKSELVSEILQLIEPLLNFNNLITTLLALLNDGSICSDLEVFT
jgi:hypothetical protein